jgi:hypothetical protein
MAAITSIVAAAGVGLAAAGAVTSYGAAQDQADANAQAIAAQQRALAIQESARKIDANRRRRQLIREGIIARSQALATTTNQGANESSGLPGAYGQIAGRLAYGFSGINIAEDTSEQLYSANQQLTAAKLAANEAAATGALGSSLSSLGGAIVGNVGTISNIFGGFGQPTAASSTSWIKT